MTVRSGQGLTGWVARNRRPLVNARPSADFEAAGLTARATTLQSALVAPLVFNDRFIGTLAVYHAQPDFYTDDHRRLLDRVSEQASAVIHNSIVFEQTQEDSLTDPLTGLPNTRFMFMHLTRELARAERLKSEVALLVMDLDNFKDINDSHGHHIGDRALREVATVLRSAHSPLRHLRPLRRRRVHRRARRAAARRKPSASASSCSARSIRSCSKRGPAAAFRSPSASARRSIRRTARPTKRCSPRPTAACIATRRAASSSRGCSRWRPAPTAAIAAVAIAPVPEPTEIDIQRAGLGVL